MFPPVSKESGDEDATICLKFLFQRAVEEVHQNNKFVLVQSG